MLLPFQDTADFAAAVQVSPLHAPDALRYDGQRAPTISA
jgi:hypothetical protein